MNKISSFMLKCLKWAEISQIRGVMRYLLYIPILFLIIGCSTIKEIPVKTEYKEIVRDSIIFKTDTVKIEVPVEKVKEVTEDTVSVLSTSLATSTAEVSNGKLSHSLEQKGEMETKIEYREKIVFKDKIIYEEVPVEVPVEMPYIPKWCWYSLAFNILIGIYLFTRIYIKIRGI